MKLEDFEKKFEKSKNGKITIDRFEFNEILRISNAYGISEQMEHLFKLGFETKRYV